MSAPTRRATGAIPSRFEEARKELERKEVAAKMSQRSNIDAAVLLKWFFRHNLRNITIRQNRDDVAAQEPRWTTGAFSFGLAPSDYTFGLKA
jgi:hypothetical protein